MIITTTPSAGVAVTTALVFSAVPSAGGGGYLVYWILGSLIT
jgi:hypothetical protein